MYLGRARFGFYVDHRFDQTHVERHRQLEGTTCAAQQAALTVHLVDGAVEMCQQPVAEIEEASLDCNQSLHSREWDSCFGERHGYIHCKQLRPEIRQRYRQWLTHKLATWHDQFGRSGCVGCGRCIAWCPVGIDITEEAKALLA